MGSGADESGDDFVVGRTNVSEDRTLLLASNGDEAPNGYEDDFVLNVSTKNDKVLVVHPEGVDAIHAKGTISYATGGSMGTIPAGNGIVAQGLNGAVGYVHGVPRDRPLEKSVGAGLLGLGNPSSPGIFGTGTSGVVGYDSVTSRDTAFEGTHASGVVGVGERGISGNGTNGPGVLGHGVPGVHGVSEGGAGVLGHGALGVIAHGLDGPGVLGVSVTEQGGVLQSAEAAQLLLVPLPMDNPLQLKRSTAGELLVTIRRDEEQRGKEIATLWFCRVGGDPTEANWVKLA